MTEESDIIDLKLWGIFNTHVMLDENIRYFRPDTLKYDILPRFRVSIDIWVKEGLLSITQIDDGDGCLRLTKKGKTFKQFNRL